MYVLTQFMSVSLHRHIRQTYRFDPFSGGFVELLAAQQTMDQGLDWYQGTADAVRKNVRYLQQPGVEYVLILSGDQLYRMDFREMIQTHRDSGADATIAALPVSSADAAGLGIMRADNQGRVIGFEEKPTSKEQLDLVRLQPGWLEEHGIESKGRDCLASMGIYLFNRDMLVDVMETTNYEDFGREVFPQLLDSQKVQVHLFDGYWEDIGTIKAYYDTNLALARPDAPFNFASPEAPVYSRARYLPPSRIDGATIRGSMIADGCEIGAGTVIENSLIGLRCMIEPNVTIRNSVIMGSDFYESADELKSDQAGGQPPVGIGAGSLIDGAIIDKNCRIGQNVHIVNEAGIENSEGDDDVCMIRDGLPMVLKGATIPNNWKL
jgi:glucose-1-phosphate adenylyltransferase